MQDVLTYEAWLESVCHICNSLLKANVSVTGNSEFKVTLQNIVGLHLLIVPDLK